MGLNNKMVSLLVSKKQHIAPILMLCVALIQLLLSQSSTLSRWRGGGYGMYTTFHPNFTQIWLIENNKQTRLDTVVHPVPLWYNPDASTKILQTCQRWPTQSCLQQLTKQLHHNTSYQRIEAWRPTFSQLEKRLSWHKVCTHVIH